MTLIEQVFDPIKDLPPEEKLKATRLLEADFYSGDLYAFAKYLMGFKDITWNTHGELITSLEAPTRRKLVCFPRDCFKSSIAAVAYASWRIVRDRNIRILLDSELFTNSKNFVRSIKGHLNSPRFIELFGEFEGPVWGESEIIVAGRTKPMVEATVTCGGIGTTKVGQHFDLIIGDDYNSPANSSSPERCKTVIDHFKYNLSILERSGEYVIIGTRYSELDLIGWILRDLLNLPGLAEGKLGEEPKGLLSGGQSDATLGRLLDLDRTG